MPRAMVALSSDEKGKVLVDAEGEALGVVTGVEDGVAFVDLDPGVGETILAGLGHDEADADDVAVEADLVADVTETEVRLRGDI
ncbi:hypothetical protein [Halomarina pelagica]|uniref:hypothetical protein n=1 Tax=Halomarina pelagica TaxID=2961599 RepID=UPI0020C47EEB|nr:hypothetical protein [Halomarina sp. BND7]